MLEIKKILDGWVGKWPSQSGADGGVQIIIGKEKKIYNCLANHF